MAIVDNTASQNQCRQKCLEAFKEDIKTMKHLDAQKKKEACMAACGTGPEPPAPTVYCCKGWQHGVLVKVQSPKPCEGQWVSCDDPDPPKPQGCESDEDCEEGYVCKDGDCVKEYTPDKIPCTSDADCGKGSTCVDGFCKKTTATDCTTDADCPEGFVCKNGSCVKPGTEEGCEGGHILDDRFNDGKGSGVRPLTEKERSPYIPEGWFRSADWQGHIVWHPDYGYRDLKTTHDYYKSGSSDWTGVVNSACEKGMERKTIGGEEWCCPAEGGGGGNGDGEGGEFKWSEGIEDALQKLLDRYNYLMQNPRGTSDAERQAIINFATERLKRGERGTMQSMTDRMARMGLSGSGFQESAAQGIQRGTREDVVSMQRQVAEGELDRRFTELMGGTQMAQGLMGTMMTGEQIPEILSAARRGEGTAAMQQFLAYLQMILGSYGQGSNWLQGILG